MRELATLSPLGATDMPALGVNLDALIPREDFASDSGPTNGTNTGTISISTLANDEFFVSGLRKPDFQRETTNWTPTKIVDLIEAFLDGDLIPAVILWRSGRFVFVIDGAHRLSALLAWVNDDYGDRSTSVKLFKDQVPEEQKRLAEQTRDLVAQRVKPYQIYKDALKQISYIDGQMRDRLGRLASDSIVAQWVPATDARGAENSFFKINQAPTPVDPHEKRILKGRKTALAIASRAVSHGGAGHKYWGHFADEAKERIEALGKAINDALYAPELGGAPIKTSDVPVAGRGYSSLPFIYDLVSLINQVPPKGAQQDDSDGSQTVAHLTAVQKRLSLVTTSSPGSLGLHPLAYFYTRGGSFQPIAFLAVCNWVKKLSDSKRLDEFTGARSKLEAFLMHYKEAFTLIVKRQGSGGRSRPAIEEFLDLALKGLVSGKSESELLESLAADQRFSFLAMPAPVRGPDAPKRAFSASVKTAAFISELETNGVRCGICHALLHRNSMHTDHVTRRTDGGGAHSGNAQVAHPYCNSGFKQQGFKVAGA